MITGNLGTTINITNIALVLVICFSVQIVVLKYPVAGLAALFSMPYLDAIHMSRINLQIVLCIALFCTCILFIIKNKRNRSSAFSSFSNPVLWLILVFTFLVLFNFTLLGEEGTWVAKIHGEGGMNIIKDYLLNAILPLFFLIVLVTDREKIFHYFYSFSAFAILSSAFIIAHYIGFGILSITGTQKGLFFYSVVVLSTAAAMSVVSSLGLINLNMSSFKKKVLIVSILLSLATILIYARRSIILVLVIASIFMIHTMVKGHVVKKIALIFLLLFLITFGAFLSGAYKRFQEVSTDKGIQYRQTVYEKAMESFKKNPIIGRGIGNFGQTFKQINPSTGKTMVFKESVHNSFLGVLVDTGFIGLFSLLCIFLILPYMYIKIKKTKFLDGDIHRYADICSGIFLIGLAKHMANGRGVSGDLIDLFWPVVMIVIIFKIGNKEIHKI